jgi:hypothetical protein
LCGSAIVMFLPAKLRGEDFLQAAEKTPFAVANNGG